MSAAPQTFIVRVWMEDESGKEAESPLEQGLPPVWRASVVSANGLERRFFASPVALVAFLTGGAPLSDVPGAQ